MCSRSSITMPSLEGLEFHQLPGRRKTLSFFVCLSFCLSVGHAFNCQSLCALFRHEGIGYRNDFDAVGQGKVGSCAPVLNFLRLLPTVDITKCRSPKSGKFFFAARER